MHESIESGAILDWLLSAARAIDKTPIRGLADFAKRCDLEAGRFVRPIDRAVAGGFLADRVGYAFAAGYGAALTRLVPGLPGKKIASLCVTEEGGGHPRAIKTKLVPGGGGTGGAASWTLSGSKRFVTAASEAELLIVAASRGVTENGKNQIKMVVVERDAEGVAITPMADLPFVPEISHGVVTLADVAVADVDILSGDGYLDYIKPFRTIEDLHVFGAVAGHLLRVALLSSWPPGVSEELSALIATIGALAEKDPLSPALHVALGGLEALFNRFVETNDPLWARVDEETRSRWRRDRALLSVAGKAREARLAAAWRHYGI
jgi:acyl-CoA dehydrogenase